MKKAPGDILILLAILIAGAGNLNGQAENAYAIGRFSNEEGFNQNTVFAIEQDRCGALWLGTSNGLIRYDGNSFQDLSWEPEYQDDVYHGLILDIYCDSRNLLWVSSSIGLNIYYPDRDRFLKLTSDTLQSLRKTWEDEDGSIWVAGNRFVARTYPEIENDSIILRWSPNVLQGEFADLYVVDILKIAGNEYLLASTTGLYRLSLGEGKGESEIKAETIIPETDVSSLALHNNLICIGTHEGLYKTILEGNRLRLFKTHLHNPSDPASISSNHITDLLVGNDNRLWVSSWFGGLSLYNEEEETFTNFPWDPSSEDGISSNMMNCVFEDSFNVLWIGTSQAGLNKLDLTRKPFTHIEYNFYDPHSLPSNLINCLMEDSQGYLWVATYFSPLCKSRETVNDKGLSNLSFDRYDDWFRDDFDKNILSIFEDKLGNIWLGYDASVAIYNPERNSFTKLVFEANGREVPIVDVREIAVVDQDRILIGGSSILILQDPWQYLGNKAEVSMPVHINCSLGDMQYVSDVIIEDRKHFWVGFYAAGLSLYSLEEDSLVLQKHYEHLEHDEKSISSDAVFSILKDGEQRMWIGTFGGGLNLLREINGDGEHEFERLMDKVGLRDNAVYGLIDQNDSILWCATDMGITRLNTRSFLTTHFSMVDGLPNNNFRFKAYHRGCSGYYYFGGLNGITAFKPDQISPNTTPPKVGLTELLINNMQVRVGEKVNKRIKIRKHISLEEKLILTKDDRTVSFESTVYHTSIPEKNSLSYMLDGFDKSWINVDQGIFTSTYTNLRPGEYTFRVRGYNCDGIATQEEATLQVIMLAPWYARTSSRILFVLIIISIISGIAWYLVKLNKLQNTLHFEQLDKERIKEINQSKLRFFTNISHEFKTPLSLISIPLQKLQEIITTDQEKEYVEMIEKNSNRLIRLIDQLLTFRRIEHGKDVLHVSKVSMDDLIYPVADAFESLSVKKGIQFFYRVKDPAYMINMDLEKMEQVLFNLLSNAFKFTPANGTVKLEGGKYKADGRYYARIKVTDTGVGIPQKDLEHIFERFFQSGPEIRKTGTGIGLSYSKSIVELHKGTIGVKSKPGKGTTFSILLPVNELPPEDLEDRDLKRLDANELLEYENITAEIIPEEDSLASQRPTVVIADDEDEFRRIIKNVLQKKYRVLEAPDGKTAMDMIRGNEPDLIISDVMMPGLNGYDLCRQVKTDMQLCHIPVILLTALEEIDSKIQGVEHGADSYISKPFNIKFLEVTVQKLIESREQIKEHFSRSHTLPKGVKISGIDSGFIQSVNRAIQQNMSDPSFGVEELAGEINLSSSQLYRKLKQLTGQIPSAYLRNYRLQAAAELLSGNRDISIKNVMYEVGIESASHFSTAFKNKFGKSPSEYT